MILDGYIEFGVHFHPFLSAVIPQDGGILAKSTLASQNHLVFCDPEVKMVNGSLFELQDGVTAIASHLAHANWIWS